MNNFFRYIIMTFLSIFLHSCSNSTEPEGQEPKIPYMSLNIGDIRQYYDIDTEKYIQIEVVDVTKRVDGLEVYVMENVTIINSVKWIGYTYHFIRDDFFWQTNLDTVREPTINNFNPFIESKLINIYSDGTEIFNKTEGVADSEKVIQESRIVDSVQTPLATFYDVLEMNQIDTDTTISIKVYYAKEYGHIETIIENNNEIYIISPIYIKVNNQEIGEYVPLL